jgi:hypothetical protein
MKGTPHRAAAKEATAPVVTALDMALRLEDLRMPVGNRLER